MKRFFAVASALGALAALVFSALMATYAFPGESARLMAEWKGLDVTSVELYPVMRFFAALFGGGNLLSVVCGTFSVVSAFVIVFSFVKLRFLNGKYAQHSSLIAFTAAVTSSILFAFSPAVLSASTHLTAESFNAALLFLVGLILMGSYICRSNGVSISLIALAGLFSALAIANSLQLLPEVLVFAVISCVIAYKREQNPGLCIFVFLLVLAAVFFVYTPIAVADFSDALKNSAKSFLELFSRKGSLLVIFAVTIPFVFTVTASSHSMRKAPGFSSWVFHFAIFLLSISVYASGLSPSRLLESTGFLPVVSSFFAAAMAAYALSFFLLRFLSEESLMKMLSGGSAAVLALVLAIAVFVNAFRFDRNAGAFADEIATRIIERMGERSWIVTEGSLDSHLRLVADKKGKKINLVCLHRDNDSLYLDSLAERVRETNLAGPKNEELVLSLSLGVLPFVQDWFAVDPTVPQSVVVYGTPDLWYSASLKPVPEMYFFGCDPDVKVDWSEWSEVDRVISANPGWGSYRLSRNENVLDYAKLSIRRYLGMVANNRGVFMQDRKDADEAWKLYSLVRDEIDADNVSALFNQFEMARAGYPAAVKQKHSIEKEFKKIVDDSDRRYVLWKLANYYGYIRNPEIFIHLGYRWARSGRPGDALAQIRRAIDFVPADKRHSLMNMIAVLHANESDTKKSRAIYESVLKTNAEDHDALMGLARLELLDGNEEKALEYLDRAAKVSPAERSKTERAMACLVRNNLHEARKLLFEVIDANPKNIASWSLYAAVVIQQYDSAKSRDEKKKFMNELESDILPSMEKHADDKFNYYLQTTRAFVMLRKGEESRRAARDAFVAAAKLRPDIGATQDIVLGLDISLNDTIEAEKHAKEVLRKNRKSPLANYVMGSLALQKGDYSTAEAFLRRSADAPRPVALAQNDLAEILRRQKRYSEAEHYARLTVKNAPKLYIAWETLASILLNAKHKDLAEIESYAQKAVDLSVANGAQEDLRVLMTLARIQILKGDNMRAKGTIRKVGSRIDELSEFEKVEFEELRKSAR